MAMGRWCHKHIQQLKIRNRLVKNPRIIKKEIVRFYKELDSQNDLPEDVIPPGFLPLIDLEQVETLERLPSKEEIYDAVRSCDPLK